MDIFMLLVLLAPSSNFKEAAAYPSIGTFLKNYCSSSCPKTPKNNPVCGSNGVIYRNLMHLYCVISCGVDVHSTGPPPCASHDDTLSLNYCSSSCPKTPENNPVCGSNGVEYRNLMHLYCVISCGVDVHLTGPPPCSSHDDTLSLRNHSISSLHVRE